MVRAEWGSLAERLLLSNAGRSNSVQKNAGVQLFYIDTAMPDLYTLPPITENLPGCTIAGVTWWLV